MPNRTCETCGAAVPSSVSFCTACGSALQVICAHCGQANPIGDRFCRGCGGGLATPQPGAGGAPNPIPPTRTLGPGRPGEIPPGEQPTVPPRGRPQAGAPSPPSPPPPPPAAAQPPPPDAGSPRGPRRDDARPTPAPPPRTLTLPSRAGRPPVPAVRPAEPPARRPAADPPAYRPERVVEDLGDAVDSTQVPERRAEAPTPGGALQQIEACFNAGDFQGAYALIAGVDRSQGEGEGPDHLKAACLFWMGRLSEAERLCGEILKNSRSSPQAEAILRQIPELRRAQAGYLNEGEKLLLPTMERFTEGGAAGGGVLRGKYECYHCCKSFNVHNPASVISPQPFLNPILCPYCFTKNFIFCRQFGCPVCHGRLSVNMLWQGLQLICPWCEARFDRPSEDLTLQPHDRSEPFNFPGRSTDPMQSTVDQEAALEPMTFGTVEELEAQLVGGKLPPWTACYRGAFDIERPLTEVASEYFRLRRHFDPAGAMTMLAHQVSWGSAPALAVILFVADGLLLAPSASYAPAATFFSYFFGVAAWALLLASPLRLLGRGVRIAAARLSAIGAGLMTAMDKINGNRTGIPKPALILLNIFFPPLMLALIALTAAGAAARGLEMAFAGISYAFVVWPVDLGMRIIDVKRRRPVLWDVQRDDGLPFEARPFYLEGVPALGKLQDFLLGDLSAFESLQAVRRRFG